MDLTTASDPDYNHAMLQALSNNKLVWGLLSIYLICSFHSATNDLIEGGKSSGECTCLEILMQVSVFKFFDYKKFRHSNWQ
jgi:hypothetical protein